MDILKIAILEYFRSKRVDHFHADEVLKVLYPEDWEHFRPELKMAALELSRDGKILIFQDGLLVSEELISENEFEIQLNPNQKT